MSFAVVPGKALRLWVGHEHSAECPEPGSGLVLHSLGDEQGKLLKAKLLGIPAPRTSSWETRVHENDRTLI